MFPKNKILKASVIEMSQLYKEKRFDIFLLMLAAFFPIFKYSVSAVILVVFSLVAIFLYYKSDKIHAKEILSLRRRYFFIFTAFYFILILSLAYTSNYKTGISSLVSSIYLLIYPLIIFLFVEDLSYRNVSQIIFCFVFACLLNAIYIHYCFYNAGLYANFKPAEIYDLPFRDVLMNLEFGKGHPTYTSMWYLFASIFLMHNILTSSAPRYQKFIFSICIVFFVGSSILLSSKITIIAFLVALMILIYLELKSKLIVAVSYVIIAALFAYGLLNISFLRARFIDEFVITEFKAPVGISTNSLNIRVGIFQCSLEIFKNNWIFGTGIGDTQTALNNCYAGFDTNVYKERTYNTHNNFVWFALSTGVIGLFAFCYLQFFLVRESIRYHNTIFLVFLVFVIICMLPENILSRNNGVVFYSIFSSLFAKLNLQTSYSV